MTEPPATLVNLLGAPTASRQRSWKAFLAQYTDLIHYAIRKTESDPDAVADAYAFVLEQLRTDDFRRLRAFDAGGRASFPTWLVIVVRRLVIDLHRRRNGRSTSVTPSGLPDPRQGLRDLVSAVSDVTRLPDPSASLPDEDLERTELIEALDQAVRALEPRDRLLLALRFQDGLSARLIAESMSFPSQFHVYRRLRAVLSELREALESVGIESARG